MITQNATKQYTGRQNAKTEQNQEITCNSVLEIHSWVSGDEIIIVNWDFETRLTLTSDPTIIILT